MAEIQIKKDTTIYHKDTPVRAVGILIEGQVSMKLAHGEITLEAGDGIGYDLGGLMADGAVGGIRNGAGGVLQRTQIFIRASAIQNFVDQSRHLAQADPAGDALAAALGKT